jgi:hypothetical protein
MLYLAGFEVRDVHTTDLISVAKRWTMFSLSFL